jgi:formylglycine-generating enzyme
MRSNPIDGAELVAVPAGEFIMGSDDGPDDERPRRRVYLNGFRIYLTEVTVAQYRAFCAACGRSMPDPPSWGWKDDHPIVNVSADDAQAYAQWAGVALPTEAQWEKAARGPDGRNYPWGNEWNPDKCHCSRAKLNDAQGTAPVTAHPEGASPCGALDMVGNVWELCADWYRKDCYRTAPSRNPTGPSSGAVRVVRGGSWAFIGGAAFRATRRANENYLPAGSDHLAGGFRCVAPLADV